MSLQVGQQLGTYTIVGPLGAGGMGEVYRATDTKLDREVAIKVLPDTMAYDRERVARFEREAKVLASLNHPMIAAIYGFDEAQGKRFLVLELVEGPTLADRIAGERLAVEEALDIARQISEALEFAHDKGIIHRDLKPANVKVTPDGQVKVLDFGLAKALAEEELSDDPANSPTITNDFTRPGVILGTAAHMSPEQARGHVVDKRSDIWSFGCVLYECLTGDSMFRGETVTDSIGAILHKQPEWDRLPANTPPTVHLLLRRCLAKDRKLRMRDIGDVRIELEAATADPSSSSLGLATVAQTTKGKATWAKSITINSAVALLTALAVSGIAWLAWPNGLGVKAPELDSRASNSESPVRTFYLDLIASSRNTTDPPVISPDGKNIVFVRNETLWIRHLGQLEPRELHGTQDARSPFWSPNSNEVGFFTNDALWRIDIAGGMPKPIGPLPIGFKLAGNGVGGAAWLDEHRIVFTSGQRIPSGLYELSLSGGQPELILEPNDGELDFESPSPLPDGKGCLFTIDTEALENSDQIAVLTNDERHVVHTLPGDELLSAVYSQTGHILFRLNTSHPGIYALPFCLIP